MAVEFGLGVLLAIVIPLGTVCLLALVILACVTMAVAGPSRRRWWVCGKRKTPAPWMSAEPPRLSLDIDNESHLSRLNQVYGARAESGKSTASPARPKHSTSLQPIVEHQPLELAWPAPTPFVTPANTFEAPTYPPRALAAPWSPPEGSVTTPVSKPSGIQPVAGLRVNKDKGKAPQPPVPPLPAPLATPPRQMIPKHYDLPQLRNVENHARMSRSRGVESVVASIVTRPSPDRDSDSFSIQQTPLSAYAVSPATTQYFTPTRDVPPATSSEYATASTSSYSQPRSPLQPIAQTPWRQRSSSTNSNTSNHNQRRSQSTVTPHCDKPLPQLPKGTGPNGVVVDLGGQLFKAIFAYTPVLYDELALKPGDLLRCYQVFDDGWCMATRVDTSEQGICPRACLVQA